MNEGRQSDKVSPDGLERIRSLLADRYAIERVIGRGGMATVYLAEDLKHERQVAVKVLNSELSATLGADRFLREIQIVSRLQHPHILPLHDSGEAGGLLYYVMPYIRGETLRDLIDREKQLPIDDAVRLIGEIASGLDHAHGLGVVHRDIKPENILLSGGHAIIADFGIARAVTEAGDEKLTRTGLVVGTAAYMSPEQAAGDASIDGRSDVYALGCMLYEMIAGQPPFTGSNTRAVIARHLTDEVPPLGTVRPSVPPAIEAAVTRALEKVPADRFTKATRFAEALSAPPPALGPYRFRRMWKRAPWLVGSLVASILVIITLTTVLLNGPAQPDRVRVVVLPFENRGAADDDYFAEGVTEEIMGKLASVARIGVIARASAIQAASIVPFDFERIGRELEVSYVLTGSVRRKAPARASDSLRVTVDMVRVADEETIWSKTYDVLQDSVFSVQSQIAQAIATQMNVVLVGNELEQVRAARGSDLSAYDYLLQGNSYYNQSWERDDVMAALENYRHAIEVDPGYALAWAQAGKTHTWIHRLGYDATEERLDSARAAIDMALSLDSNLPEAHIADGLYYYWGRWQYQEAIERLSIARGLQPNNAWVPLQMGNIRRRQGMWDQAIGFYEAARDLDPRFHIMQFNIAEVYYIQRKYDEAREHAQFAVDLAPDFLDGWLELAAIEIHARSDTAAARQLIADAGERIPEDRWRPLAAFWLLGFGRMIIPLDDMEQRLKPGLFGVDSTTYPLVMGEMHERLGHRALAAEWYDSARVRLEALEAEQPGIAWIHGALGVAYAGLGRDDEAIRAARAAMQAMPVQRDAFEGPDWTANMARVQMMVGNHDRAIDYLSQALDYESRLSRNWVALDPVWEPLHSEPRFAALIAEPDPTPAAPDPEPPPSAG